MQNSANESLSVEGYTYKSAAVAGSSPGDLSIKFYFGKMFSYWKLAGYNIQALERTCTVFGDSGNELFGRTILK
jgi:hypothetical protein